MNHIECAICHQTIKQHGCIYQYNIGWTCIDCQTGAYAPYKPNQKPGIYQKPSEVAKIFGILLGTALAFLIVILLCSCAKDTDPYNDIDAALISIEDQLILDSLRRDGISILDSSRVRYIEVISSDSAIDYQREVNITLHDDSIGMGTLGFCIMRKVPPDSVLLVRSRGILWAFWCKDW